MKVNLTEPTLGSLRQHVTSPPSLPVCFDSSEGVNCPRVEPPLDFIVKSNVLAWALCDEIYPLPHSEELDVEWNSVDHTVPRILSKWRNYGLFGTNIEGWFTLDPHDMDSMLRAIALFGFVLWVNEESVKVLCGFHRKLGINVFGEPSGLHFEDIKNFNAEVYVVIPTIMAECEHQSMQYLHYETLETE